MSNGSLILQTVYSLIVTVAHFNLVTDTVLRILTMADKAAANRSLNTIRTELQYLHDSGIVNDAQYQSIMAQLPVTISCSITLHLEFRI